MSHGRYIKPDVLSLAELLHLTFRKVRTIICDDAMWETETKNNLFEKLNRRGCITFTDGLRFNPFGELVNRHQQVGLLVLRMLKGSNHIKPPSSKWPSDGNHA